VYIQVLAWVTLYHTGWPNINPTGHISARVVLYQPGVALYISWCGLISARLAYISDDWSVIFYLHLILHMYFFLKFLDCKAFHFICYTNIDRFVHFISFVTRILIGSFISFHLLHEYWYFRSFHFICYMNIDRFVWL
jgi:hypothetical protein